MFRSIVKGTLGKLGFRVLRASTLARLEAKLSTLHALQEEVVDLRREKESGRKDMHAKPVTEPELIFQELFRLTVQVRILQDEKSRLEQRLEELESKPAPAAKAA